MCVYVFKRTLVSASINTLPVTRVPPCTRLKLIVCVHNQAGRKKQHGWGSGWNHGKKGGSHSTALAGRVRPVFFPVHVARGGRAVPSPNLARQGLHR